MKQRQSMGGVGLLILMLLVIMFFSLKVPGMATERELSYPEFMVYLENKTVESAQIRPNREVPTGEVVFETFFIPVIPSLRSNNSCDIPLSWSMHSSLPGHTGFHCR